MGSLTLSDKYGIAAAIGLGIVVAINNALVMLIVAIAGILAGLWVLRQGAVRRVCYVALAGFVVAAVFAVIELVGVG
jgi:hypothetical protein